MAKSLKPTTTTGHPAPAASAAEPQRRGFLAGAAALIIGGIVGLVPMGAGLLVFLDPILKRKAKAGGNGAGKIHGPTCVWLRSTRSPQTAPRCKCP